MIAISPSEVVKEVFTVILVYAILAVLLLPVLLVLAIGLGPVLLGILCAIGFGLIVFVVVNLVIGLGLSLRSMERHVRHVPSERHDVS